MEVIVIRHRSKARNINIAPLPVAKERFNRFNNLGALDLTGDRKNRLSGAKELLPQGMNS
jgi:hypothetical protein